MKTGIELISGERKEQIQKHGRTIEQDIQYNANHQLTISSQALIYTLRDMYQRNNPPFGWELKAWQKLYDKPYKERLIIAGALLAAEIDRIQNS